MEADVRPDTNTCKLAEDAAADQAKHGDRCSAKRVDAGPTSLTSFGKIAEPSLAPEKYISDALVDKSTAAPKPCLSPVEMRTLTAAGDLLPANTASIATRTLFHQPPLWFCPTEGMDSSTSFQYTMYYSSFWKVDVLERTSIQYDTTYYSIFCKMKSLAT